MWGRVLATHHSTPWPPFRKMAHKKAPRGGDDLDDDFAVEAVTGPAPKAAAAGPAARPAAGSSGKKRKAEASGDALEDGFVAAPALLDNNDKTHKKHKKGGAGASAGAAVPVVIAEEDDEALQAKLAEAKRERRKRQKATNLESGKRRTPDVSTALGVDTAAQAEYWTYWYRATAKDWRSEAELTDRPFGAEFFVDTVAFGQEHKDEAWASFVKHGARAFLLHAKGLTHGLVYPKWQKNFKSKATPNKGAPVVIVLTSAGQRAADVVRYSSPDLLFLPLPFVFTVYFFLF